MLLSKLHVDVHLTSRQKLHFTKTHTARLPQQIQCFIHNFFSCEAKPGFPDRVRPTKDPSKLLKLTRDQPELTAPPLPAQHAPPQPLLFLPPAPLSPTLLCHRQLHVRVAANPKAHPVQAERDSGGGNLQKADIWRSHPGCPFFYFFYFCYIYFFFQAVIDASVAAGLSITIPIPQLETEALFYTPFSFSAEVSEADMQKIESKIFSSGSFQLHRAANGCAGEEHQRAVDNIHKARDGS